MKLSDSFNQPINRNYCEYKCSKYCEILDFDMNKVNDKYCCAACYNCATEGKT